MVEKNKESGITLIELIISISLSSIILLSIVSVFVTSSKIYEDIYSYTEIQQQSHFIMDFLTDTVLHSNDLAYIDKDSSSNTHPTYGVEICEFSLIDDSLNKGERHIFSLRDDKKVEGKLLRYGRKSPTTIEVGNFIDKMYLKTLNGSSHEDIRGVKITLSMKKRGKSFEISKEVYFRVTSIYSD